MTPIHYDYGRGYFQICVRERLHVYERVRMTACESARARKRALVVSWLEHRYVNPKVRGSNPGLDGLRIFMV